MFFQPSRNAKAAFSQVKVFAAISFRAFPLLDSLALEWTIRLSFHSRGTSFYPFRIPATTSKVPDAYILVLLSINAVPFFPISFSIKLSTISLNRE
ncbi:unnamed protein product [Nesidiocoris tenuis]|uniref:Uncharacterized protein n=1 Tax=Nesidiocoris tenuis TaxID=355587 RepID=A0A6H5H4L8_9HEMI|nr:unnamed protein product [Nesidiocoris tenuis]